jgi:DNA-binding response OmpR family regulator
MGLDENGIRNRPRSSCSLAEPGRELPLVLVIDDDDAVRASVAFLLETAGFAVVAAADGREGLCRHDEVQPDLVITDIMMPHIEGIEVILRLREVRETIPILAISGGWHRGGASLLEMVAKLGATETLAKPFTAEDLLAAIKRCRTQSNPEPHKTCRRQLAPSASEAADNFRLGCLVSRHTVPRQRMGASG